MSISCTTESNTAPCSAPPTEERSYLTGWNAVMNAVPCEVSWNSWRSARYPLAARTVAIRRYALS